jgi:hypothetical protein
VHCGGYSGSKSPNRPSSSPRNGDRPSRLRALPGLWNGLERLPNSASRLTPICCVTPVALRWPTKAMIPGLYRPISGTRISSTPFAIPSYRRIGSRTFGDDHLCLSLNESADQAALYFRGSVENQQAFDSGYSAASWSLQPHRHISSGIRPTEQTSWLSSRLWRFKLDARVRQIKSEPGAMHNVPNFS